MKQKKTPLWKRIVFWFFNKTKAGDRLFEKLSERCTDCPMCFSDMDRDTGYIDSCCGLGCTDMVCVYPKFYIDKKYAEYRKAEDEYWADYNEYLKS